MAEVVEVTRVRTPSAGVSLLIEDEIVLHGRAATLYLVLSVAVCAAIAIFAGFWITLSGRTNHPIAFAIVTLLIAYLLTIWVAPWFALARMRRPIHIAPEPGLRVAAATTFVSQSESLPMLELSLRGLLDMRYPHDTWVLDENNDPDVEALCRRLGARHFSRHDRPEYQAAQGRFAAHTKYGNYNAWLSEVGCAGYDVLATFDPDHVPEPDYLERTLGYLCDSQVGYVQTPQVYYNQQASLIARGSAEESYLYYSALQMASYALGEPTITGSHTVHRISALRAVEGFPAHDAEDLYITLLYRAARWRGIYVPEVLALGTTPVDWRSYLRQQMRWARALLDLKLRVYPSFVRRLEPLERLLSLFHGAYYLRPLVLLFVYPMLAFMLVTNGRPVSLSLDAVVAFGQLCVVLTLADRFRQRYYLDPKREGGIHWRALLLQFAKWPYFVIALWQALRGRSRGYDITPKTQARSARGALALPHLSLAGGLCVAALIGVARYGSLSTSVLAAAAVFVALSVGLACTELLEFPAPFDAERHLQRRQELAAMLASRR